MSQNTREPTEGVKRALSQHRIEKFESILKEREANGSEISQAVAAQQRAAELEAKENLLGRQC